MHMKTCKKLLLYPGGGCKERPCLFAATQDKAVADASVRKVGPSRHLVWAQSRLRKVWGLAVGCDTKAEATEGPSVVCTRRPENLRLCGLEDVASGTRGRWKPAREPLRAPRIAIDLASLCVG